MKKDKIILSGGRPTGRLHLGHYVGAFQKFVEFQDTFSPYFIISDIHFLTTKWDKKSISKIESNTINMVVDAIGMGVNPSKTIFYLQSNIPELTYIYILFQNYIDYKRLELTPSLLEMKKHTHKDEMSLGLLAYPVMEAGDIYALNADVVPVGRDNIDHLKVCKEILEKINCEFHSQIKIPSYISDNRTNYLVGVDGSEKMSKSLDNAIYIRDNREIVYKKIMSMSYIAGDENSTVLKYLKVFCPEDVYKIILKESFSEEQAKKVLFEEIEKILAPMRKRMQPYLNDPKIIEELLKSGTKKVRLIVKKQLIKLKQILSLYEVC